MIFSEMALIINYKELEMFQWDYWKVCRRENFEKALFELTLGYLIKDKNKNMISELIVLADACLR